MYRLQTSRVLLNSVCKSRLFGTTRPNKRKVSIPVVHGSQKPEPPIPENFDKMGLQFVPTLTPKVILKKTHWTVPPEKMPDLPFVVERVGEGKNLPVYTDFKGGGTKVVTILRQCKGDIELLKSEMEKVTGRPVEVRPGSLHVKGRFVGRLKLWLSSLGF